MAAQPEASSLDPGVEMPKCDFDPGKYDVSFFDQLIRIKSTPRLDFIPSRLLEMIRL